ncbi:hypothetical protein G6F54_014129 [Rhizopus delemar]|nr:hypothetical protein G6F54_014129 [Rhizopus delemar]
MPCAEYSKVSNCCITGSGSSGCAGRARSPSTHFSRLGASPGVLVTPRPQAASNRTANALAPRAMYVRITSCPPCPSSSPRHRQQPAAPALRSRPGSDRS